MKHIFIINPTAGKYDSRQRIYEMADHLRTAHGLDVQCILTKKQGHATEIARKLCQTGEPLRFYACGGDGTLNEILQGTVGHPNAAIGCVPCAAGSGVDLRDERHAGVHLARRWVYDKNMLHRFVPFSIGYLRSTDTNYCSFFAAKVQYLGGNWLAERLASPSGEAVSGPDH